MDAHHAAVAAVSARVRHFHLLQKPFRIYHGTTNSTRHSDRRLENTVDTSRLDHVLHVDTVRKVVLAEPNVPMDALVEATLPHGLVPQVVMEFPGITAGGGFSGSSGESSSFRYGLFDATVNAIEMVLGNGDVVTASRSEKPDLFWGAASAFGTLGVVTVLEIQLIGATAYVELTYDLAPTVAAATARLREETKRETNDYVDAIVFALDSALICTGRLVDALPEGVKPQHFSRSYDPWFYTRAKRLQRRLKRTPGQMATDYVPLVDYLFRYDRGAFWTATYAFKYFITPFNRVTRFILNPFMHTRVMYRAMHKSGLSDFYMVQDVGVPYDRVDEFTLWLHENLNIYPLWLCPLRVRRGSPDARHGLHSAFADPAAPDLMNVGIWGPISFNRREVVRQNRALERKVHDLGGQKWLYAHAYYTEDEFWAHYDRASYDALRAKYSASYLPNVYDKVKVDVDAEEARLRASMTSYLLWFFWSLWPLRGLYGVYNALVGGDYLLRKPKRKPTPDARAKTD